MKSISQDPQKLTAECGDGLHPGWKLGILKEWYGWLPCKSADPSPPFNLSLSPPEVPTFLVNGRHTGFHSPWDVALIVSLHTFHHASSLVSALPLICPSPLTYSRRFFHHPHNVPPTTAPDLLSLSTSASQFSQGHSHLRAHTFLRTCRTFFMASPTCSNGTRRWRRAPRTDWRGWVMLPEESD